MQLLCKAWMVCSRKRPWQGDKSISHSLLQSKVEWVSRTEAAQSSSPAPGAMAVTRTSSSTGLMASDKCVMGGSYQGHRSEEAALTPETLFMRVSCVHSGCSERLGVLEWLCIRLQFEDQNFYVKICLLYQGCNREKHPISLKML